MENFEIGLSPARAAKYVRNGKIFFGCSALAGTGVAGGSVAYTTSTSADSPRETETIIVREDAENKKSFERLKRSALQTNVEVEELREELEKTNRLLEQYMVSTVSENKLNREALNKALQEVNNKGYEEQFETIWGTIDDGNQHLEELFTNQLKTIYGILKLIREDNIRFGTENREILKQLREKDERFRDVIWGELVQQSINQNNILKNQSEFAEQVGEIANDLSIGISNLEDDVSLITTVNESVEKIKEGQIITRKVLRDEVHKTFPMLKNIEENQENIYNYLDTFAGKIIESNEKVMESNRKINEKLDQIIEDQELDWQSTMDRFDQLKSI